MVIQTPRCLCGSFGDRTAKGSPLSVMLSVAILFPVFISTPTILVFWTAPADQSIPGRGKRLGPGDSSLGLHQGHPSPAIRAWLICTRLCCSREGDLSAVVRLCCCTASLICDSAAVLLHCCSVSLLDDCSAARFHCCTDLLLHHSISVRLLYCTFCLLSHFAAARFLCSTTPLYASTAVQLRCCSAFLFRNSAAV